MKQNKQTKLIVGYLSNTENIVEVPMVCEISDVKKQNKQNNSRKFYMCIQSQQSLIRYYVGMNSIVGKPLQIHNTYMWEKKLQKKDPLQISCERKKQKKKKN